MRKFNPRRSRLTVLTSTVGLLILSAAACGIDDSRTMTMMSQAAGSAGLASGGSGNMVADGGEAGEGGARSASAGSGGKSGSGGMGGKGGGGAAGSGGKAGSGPVGPCGNGKIDSGEECDDSNTKSGDGCSAQCQSKCETCEKSVYAKPEYQGLLQQDYYETCFTATDRALGGPADGAPRKDLCAAVVDCVRRTGCGALGGFWVDGFAGTNDASLSACWCSDLAPLAPGDRLPQPAASCNDAATLKPGPCYADFQNASEADSPKDIGKFLIDEGTALGRAGQLLRVQDSLFCATSCWPDPATQGGMGGTGGIAGGGMGGTGGVGGSNGGAAGTGGKGGSGGFGGTAGSGGSGGGGSACGNGKLDGGEECEPPSTNTCSDDCKRVVDDACASCEETEIDGACAQLPGCLAFDGALRSLCYDVMECVRKSNCADGGVGTTGLTNCFCGSLSTSSCVAAPSSGAGAPAGACASLIRQGTTNSGGTPATNSEVLTRILDNTFPAGAAIERLNCQWGIKTFDCHTKCGF